MTNNAADIVAKVAKKVKLDTDAKQREEAELEDERFWMKQYLGQQHEGFKAQVWPRYQHVKPDDLLPELQVVTPGSGLFLWGANGVGKTHQAWAYWMHWVNFYFQQHGAYPKHRVWSMSHFMDAFKPGGGAGGETLTKESLKLDGETLFFLDDLGEERTTDYSKDVMHWFIGEAYNRRQPLLITSNLDLDKVGKRYGKRISSRLAEMTNIMQVGGKDRRIGYTTSKQTNSTVNGDSGE